MSTSMPLMQSTSFASYLRDIENFSMLDADAELQLTTEYFQTQDENLAKELICANLRFVVYIAKQYRAYGIQIAELVQEGNIGLMVAIKKFDPSRKVRLVSYASWWIRAKIHQYLIANMSLVKFGTTQMQKKLFFAYRRTRDKLLLLTGEASIRDIAEELQLSEEEVQQAKMRLTTSDSSLDTPIFEASAETRMDAIPGDLPSPEEYVAENELTLKTQYCINTAFDKLNDRERVILRSRFEDESATLQEIADHYNVSRERIRQIETNAKRKVRKAVLNQPNSKELFEELHISTV